MSYFKKIMILALCGVVVLFFFLRSEKPAETVFLPHEAMLGTTSITLELADTFSLQMKGLSDRPSLQEGSGMLFIFPSSAVVGFWMKDMHFPIDMIFLDEQFKIITITKNVSPESFPKTFSPSAPARYVLEVNAGVSDATGIKEGDTVLFK